MAGTSVLPSGRILRYGFPERLTHWIAGVSYVYLLVTGLAFWSPWLFWMAVILGGGPVSRALHPWIGLIFTVSVLWMYRLWGGQMRSAPIDKQWWDSIRAYIRNEDEQVPSADRFNAGQKALFWSFFWGGVLLFLSGLVLWFSDSLPWNMRFLRYLAVLIHPIVALFTIGAFIIHVYMGTAVERGSFGSVIRGDVSASWTRRYHRSWYEQITRKSPANK